MYARAFEAPGAMRGRFEMYKELDHDAEVHRKALEDGRKLTIPVLAGGGGEQALAKNYGPMCETIAENVTLALIPGSGHWVAEERPSEFVTAILDFDTTARKG